MMRKTATTLCLTLLLCPAGGCGKSTRSDATPHAEARLPENPDPMGFQYPQARWRLAPFEELERVTLWLGHIVVRHEQSQVDLFRALNWRPDPPNPKRTPAEALALAEKIRAQAAATPGSFEQLAREYSEDVVSKDDGGMLGGLRASQLVNSDFLDALAVLQPGEVSRVFRTPFGFHILKRYAPPADEQIAGERIVIGYQGVFGLVNETRRTRDQALRLAVDIAEQAKRNPGEFVTLVRRHSENVDRIQNGDLGVYSTRDPEFFGVEVQRLAQLAIGEVTGPVDSRFGFEILRRVPVVPRTEYAVARLELPFDGRPAEREASAARALQKAQLASVALHSAPDRFGEFQRMYCCDRVERWTRGRDRLQLSREVEALSLGAISPKPFLHGNAYLILKRLDPATLPPDPPRLSELPNPTEPNYEALLSYNNGKQIAAAARAFLGELRKNRDFAGKPAQTIADALDQLAANLDRNPGERAFVRAAVQSTLAELERRLGTDQFDRFKGFGRRWATLQIMPSATGAL